MKTQWTVGGRVRAGQTVVVEPDRLLTVARITQGQGRPPRRGPNVVLWPSSGPPGHMVNSMDPVRVVADVRPANPSSG